MSVFQSGLEFLNLFLLWSVGVEYNNGKMQAQLPLVLFQREDMFFRFLLQQQLFSDFQSFSPFFQSLQRLHLIGLTTVHHLYNFFNIMDIFDRYLILKFSKPCTTTEALCACAMVHFSYLLKSCSYFSTKLRHCPGGIGGESLLKLCKV